MFASTTTMTTINHSSMHACMYVCMSVHTYIYRRASRHMHSHSHGHSRYPCEQFELPLPIVVHGLKKHPETYVFNPLNPKPYALLFARPQKPFSVSRSSYARASKTRRCHPRPCPFLPGSSSEPWDRDQSYNIVLYIITYIYIYTYSNTCIYIYIYICICIYIYIYIMIYYHVL